VRRVLELIAIAILVMAFAQTAPIELAFLFAGDTLMYLEFAVIIRLAAGRDHFAHVLRLAARLARSALPVVRAVIDRSVGHINKWRDQRNPARPAKPRNTSDKSDDGPGLGATWAAFTTA
jgi:hypothetical protein